MRPRAIIIVIATVFLLTMSCGSALAARPVHYFDCKDCHIDSVSLFELGNSNLCLQCHKNPPASVTFNDATTGHTPNGMFSTNDASDAMGSATAAGYSPTKETSHNWAHTTDVVPAAGAQAPSVSLYRSRYGISNGKLTCSRCHEPHDNVDANPKLLRMSAASDAICLDCHTPWNDSNNKGLETHPLVTDYATVQAANPTKYKASVDNSANGASGANGDVRLVDTGGGNMGVSCTSCHSVHFADSDATTADGLANQGSLSAGDGKLLRSDGRVVGDADLSSALCTACHVYKKHGNANAIGCLDCHSGHSYNNGTPNYYVLRNESTLPYIPKTAAAGTATGLSYTQVPGANANKWMDGGSGYCEGCHNLGASHNGYATGTALTNCNDCHLHNNTDGSFAANCTQCHGYPPTQDVAGGDPNTGYASISAANNYRTGTTSKGVNPKDESLTAHGRHAGSGDYGLDCNRCHDRFLQDGLHNNGTYENVVFDAISSQGMAPAPSYDVNGAGTCSNVYCHSNGDPRGAGATASAIPAWQGGSIADCTSCHGNDSASMTTKSNSATHQDHLGKGYSCDVCHVDTAADNSNSALAAGAVGGAHVDGDKDVSFDTSHSLGAANLTVGGTPYTAGTGVCMVYCHTDGRGNYASPDWDLAASGACGTCHNRDVASGSPMTTGSHTAHINDSDNEVGRNIGCAECHSNTVSDNSTISNQANHVDGQFDLGIAADSNKTTCSNISCHSDGNFDGALTYKNQTWGGAALAGCDDCHGDGAGKAYPTYANGGVAHVNANSHSAHVVGGGYSCGECHKETTSDGSAINGTVKTTHVNQTVNVLGDKINGGAAGWNNGTKTCSAVDCHGGNSPVWGDTLGCADCHMRSAGDVDDFTYNNATVAMIDAEEWTFSGHGLAAASTYEVTGRAGADFPASASGSDADPCLYCHDDSASHGASTFRLRTNGFADLNGACLACHGTFEADGVTPTDGFDPDGAGGDYANEDSAVKIDKYHGGVKHGDPRDGGRWCWDCHDPHGDADTGGLRIQMLQRHVAVNPDANGFPASLTATDIIFTDNTVGAGAGGFARDNGAGSDGICNACHTTTNQYKTDLGANGHPTAQCTLCHGHSGDTTYDQLAFKATCYNCHGGDISGVDEQNYWPSGNPGGADTDYGSGGTINDAGEHAAHITELAQAVYGETATGAADDDILKDNTTANPGLTSDQKQRALCGYCHASPGSDADHANSTPADTAEVTQFKQIWDGSVDAAPAASYTAGDGSCSNIDCHNGKNTTASNGWYANASSSCAMCHDDNLPTTGTHYEHLKTTFPVYYTVGQIACTDCHEAGTDWATNSAPDSGHRNGTFAVSQGDFTYTGTYTDHDTSTAGTCGTNDCHNNGKGGAPNVAYTWGTANAAGCAFCHTNSGEAHTPHFNANNVIVPNGTISCTTCHTHSGPDTDHFNGTVNLKAALGYTGNLTVGTAGFGSCDTTTCHQDGRGTKVTTPAWDAGPSATNNCSVCHGTTSSGRPNTGKHAEHVKAPASVPAYGETTVNVSNDSTAYDFGCGNCHPTDKAQHLDSADWANPDVDVTLNSSHGGTLKAKNNVANDTNGDGYNQTRGTSVTCSAAYCHSYIDAGNTRQFQATPNWYGSGFAGDPCAGCHANSPASNAHHEHEVGFHYDAVYSGLTGFFPVKDSDPYDGGLTGTVDQLRGHGGNTAGNGTTSTSTVINCHVCHWNTVKVQYNANNSNSCSAAGCHTAVASPTNSDKWAGNAAIELDSYTAHVNGSIDVVFFPQVVKSKAQIRDDLADVNELNNNWSRPGGYKATSGLSYDETTDTLDNLSTWNNADKTCTVACHLWEADRVDKVPASWEDGSIMCIDCHTRLPK